jgi:hypothetical protein
MPQPLQVNAAEGSVLLTSIPTRVQLAVAKQAPFSLSQEETNKHKVPCQQHIHTLRVRTCSMRGRCTASPSALPKKRQTSTAYHVSSTFTPSALAAPVERQVDVLQAGAAGQLRQPLTQPVAAQVEELQALRQSWQGA